MSGMAEVLLVGACAIITLLTVVSTMCILVFVWVSKSSENYPQLTDQVALLTECLEKLILNLAISVSIIWGRTRKVDYASIDEFAATIDKILQRRDPRLSERKAGLDCASP